MGEGGGVEVEIVREAEEGHGWRYGARVRWADGSIAEHVVTLSWVDHDHLCGGVSPPSGVVKVALALAAGLLGPGRLPRRFDISQGRRLIEDFDGLLQARLPNQGSVS